MGIWESGSEEEAGSKPMTEKRFWDRDEEEEREEVVQPVTRGTRFSSELEKRGQEGNFEGTENAPQREETDDAVLRQLKRTQVSVSIWDTFLCRHLSIGLLCQKPWLV